MTVATALVSSEMRKLEWFGFTDKGCINMPKKLGNITEQFLSYETWDYAERCARKGKETKRRDIIAFHKENNTPEKRKAALMRISDSIRNRTYLSSEVIKMERMEGGKWRIICTVQYYPDRIVHFAIFNMIKDRLAKTFIRTMYSYDKGVHELTRDIRRDIKEWSRDLSIYILNIDIAKFYDSIDIHILLDQLRHLIKDKTIMWLIEEILTSHNAVVIGMLLSTIFSSLYLSKFDRWVKEELRVKHYYRFADDFLILHHDSRFLKEISWRIMHYLHYNLKLRVRYSDIFNIERRPLDYCGYIHYRTHVLLRKETKKKFIKSRHKPASVASYLGMLKWCDSKHLIYKTLVLNNGKKCTNSRKEVS